MEKPLPIRIPQGEAASLNLDTFRTPSAWSTRSETDVGLDVDDWLTNYLGQKLCTLCGDFVPLSSIDALLQRDSVRRAISKFVPRELRAFGGRQKGQLPSGADPDGLDRSIVFYVSRSDATSPDGKIFRIVHLGNTDDKEIRPSRDSWGRYFYFINLNSDASVQTPGPGDKHVESWMNRDVMSGELDNSLMLEDVYLLLKTMRTRRREIDPVPPPKSSHSLRTIDVPDAMEAFATKIFEASENLKESVRLKLPATVSDKSLVDSYRASLRSWFETIRFLLDDADTVHILDSEMGGPSLDLRYWRQRTVVCDSVLKEMQAYNNRAFLGDLSKNFPDLSAKWKQLCARLVELRHESQNNVKHLQSIDHFFQPLYRTLPPKLNKAIKGIVQAIRWMSSLSHFYDNPSRVTFLFMKVSEQLLQRICVYVRGTPQKGRSDSTDVAENAVGRGAMVSGHRARLVLSEGEVGGQRGASYLQDKVETTSVWNSDAGKLGESAGHVAQLVDTYKAEFLAAKANVSSANSKWQFDLPEEDLFGKLDKLCERLNSIASIVQTLENFEALNDFDFKNSTHFDPGVVQSVLNEVWSLRRYLVEEIPHPLASMTHSHDHSNSNGAPMATFERGSVSELDGDGFLSTNQQQQRPHSPRSPRSPQHGKSGGGTRKRAWSHSAETLSTTNSSAQLLSSLLRSSANFDLLYSACEQRFEIFVEEVDKQVAYAVKGFIGSLRDTKHALDIMIQLRKMPLFQRPRLDEELQEQCQEMLARFAEEVVKVEGLYKKEANQPPQFRDMPSVVSSICWARQLSRRIEEPLEKFNQISLGWFSLKQIAGNREETSHAMKMSKKLLRALAEFELRYIEEWSRNASQTVAECFSKPILTLSSKNLNVEDGSHTKKAGTVSKSLTQEESKSQGRDRRVYKVNFDWKIRQCTREVKLLSNLHVIVPEQIRAVSDHADLLQPIVQKLEYLVKQFQTLVSKVNDGSYKVLLRPWLSKLEKKFRPGIKLVTWNSTNINLFCEKIQDDLSQVTDLVEKANDMMDAQIIDGFAALEQVNLAPDPSTVSNGKFMLENWLASYVEQCETMCEFVSSKSSSINASVGELVTLFSWRNGKDLRLQHESAFEGFSRTHEHQLRDILKKTIVRNLCQLQHFLLGLNRQQHSHINSSRLLVPQASLAVEVELKIPYFVTCPTLDELKLATKKVVKAILGVVGNIPPWMNSWMKDVPNGVNDAGQLEEDSTSSPLQKVLAEDPTVNSVIDSILGDAFEGRRLLLNDIFEDFSCFEWLWQKDMHKEINLILSPTADKMIAGASTINIDLFEDKFTFFNEQADKIRSLNLIEGSVRPLSLSLTLLKQMLMAEVERWQNEFGMALGESTRQEVDAIAKFLEGISQKINTEVDGISGLFDKMSLLSKVRDQEPEIEMRFFPIMEAHKLLKRFDIRLLPQDEAHVLKIRKRWEELGDEIEVEADNLNLIQPKFRRMLIQMSADFRENVTSFKQRWADNGPKDKGLDFNEALSRYTAFKHEHVELSSRQTGIHQGESLFALPRSNTKALDKIQFELKQLHECFKLYGEMNAAIEKQKATVWVNLDFQIIRSQMKAVASNAQDMQSFAMGYDIFQRLDTKLREYLRLLPLLIKMSHHSFGPQQWKEVETAIDHYWSNDMHFLTLSSILLAQTALLFNMEAVEMICLTAQKEHEVLQQFSKVQDDWVFKALFFQQQGMQQLMSPKAKSPKASTITDTGNPSKSTPMGPALHEHKMATVLLDLEESATILSALLNSRFSDKVCL
jgi:dynein heavy chain